MVPILAVFVSILCGFTDLSGQANTLDINTYLNAANGAQIYPSEEQLAMLKAVIPDAPFQPAPPVSNREFWDKIAVSDYGARYLANATAEMEKKPEVPISDEIYRRANKEGNRPIYKPRYYRTMDRLEKFVLAECIENEGRFLSQIEVYSQAILKMKSWLHPNHDDKDNSVLEGKRVAIDLGARKFGLVLALTDALLEDKLTEDLRTQIATHLQWRIIDSYFKSCKGEDTVGNRWVKSTSNWNSVCTSGTVFTAIVASKNKEERLAAVGCALNSMVYYLSGFGEDGYCSEGTGYWSYGFGHYLYLAEILDEYSQGKINLFDFNEAGKLKKVGSFPENFQIHPGLYAPFSDGVVRVKKGNANFAYVMAAKHYAAQKPARFVPDESVQELIIWADGEDYTAQGAQKKQLPEVTYFDDYGVVISRGQQNIPFSIAIKAGHNAENHNHSDVGSYVLVLGDDIVAGDIGAPSYIAGAFSPDNPARSSWGHPVPRIDNLLQANGRSFHGKILDTDFAKDIDRLVMDIKTAYEIPALKTLKRYMINDKKGRGAITVKDEFSANRPLSFGTAIMTFSKYEIMDDKTIILTSVDQKVKVKAEIECTGGKVKIVPEPVPVQHLRNGKDAVRIGINFDKPIQSGAISITYIPIVE